ncbi:TPA: Rha family transcriptional regulator [Klebsiella pneumoniae]|nr:Rha family transcriptional regulator [Klebsiella pneumoniae]HDS4740975.1 Rha family transcriptional regulator [Klebsiella pneumoniae]HDS4749480.1 Rha family transcriptional regulator [Klebsiella pneumoniae]HDS4753662.1 Rha family transcriptional regulator [Klebsiella pneumoniae]
MNSIDIAGLVGSRHDSVKRAIERLAAAGVISQPPMEDGEKSANGVVTKVFIFEGEKGKRDSIIVVAQLSPEFTARLVDRWQELETQISEFESQTTEISVVTKEGKNGG